MQNEGVTAKEAAKFFQIPNPKVITDWKKKGDLSYWKNLAENNGDLKKFKKTNNSCHFPELETQLLQEIDQRESKGLDRSLWEWVPDRAKQLHKQLYPQSYSIDNNEPFKASVGLLFRIFLLFSKMFLF